MSDDIRNQKPPVPRCEVCGEPMPPGEEIFMFHGYSGPCPKPPIGRKEVYQRIAALESQLADLTRQVQERDKTIANRDAEIDDLRSQVVSVNSRWWEAMVTVYEKFCPGWASDGSPEMMRDNIIKRSPILADLTAKLTAARGCKPDEYEHILASERAANERARNAEQERDAAIADNAALTQWIDRHSQYDVTGILLNSHPGYALLAERERLREALTTIANGEIVETNGQRFGPIEIARAALASAQPTQETRIHPCPSCPGEYRMAGDDASPQHDPLRIWKCDTCGSLISEHHLKLRNQASAPASKESAPAPDAKGGAR